MEATTEIQPKEIVLTETQFNRLSGLVVTTEIIEDKAFSKLFLHENKCYAITSYCSSNKIYDWFGAYEIIHKRVYKGPVEPLPYSLHFDQVNLGNRERSYKYMLCKWKKEEIVLIEKVVFVKEDGDKGLKTNNVSHVSNESAQVVSIGKHTPEDKPVVKEVDGLQQIQLFEDTQVKTRRDPDADLFGYKAKDKTDRQRFKRKLAQLQSKLQGLSVLERTALIRGLNAKFTPPL